MPYTTEKDRTIEAIISRLGAGLAESVVVQAGFDATLVAVIAETHAARIAELRKEGSTAITPVPPRKVVATEETYKPKGKGNKAKTLPVLNFAYAGEGWGFSFGRRKANFLVEYAQQNGAEALVKVMQDFIANNSGSPEEKDE